MMVFRICSTLSILVVTAIGLYLYSTQLTPADERDRPITVAFGPATENEVEMELCVTDLMLRHEPPGPMSQYRSPHEWSRAHLHLVDANDVEMTWRRKGSVQYTTGPAAGLSDGFLLYRLKPGATYKLTFTPSVAEGINYSCEFEASTAAEITERLLMLPRE